MKRLLGLILCLMMINAASAECYIVSYNQPETYEGRTLLLDESGNLLGGDWSYTYIVPITGSGLPEGKQLYQAAIADKTLIPEGYDPYNDYEGLSIDRAALLGTDGRLLTGFDYISFSYDEPSGCLLYTTPESLVGVMDLDGNILMEAKYAAVAPNGQGGYLVAEVPEGTSVDYQGVYPIAYLDGQGHRYNTGISSSSWSLRPYSDGYALVFDVPEYNGRTVFLDTEGNIAFSESYASAQSFEGGYAIADTEYESSSGVIDTSGQAVIPFQYDYISATGTPEDGTFICHPGNGYDVYNRSTLQRVIRIRNDDAISIWEAGGTWLNISDGDRLQLYDTNGVMLFSAPSGASVDSWFVRCEGNPERVIVTTGEWPFEECRLMDLSGRQRGDVFQSLYASLWKNGQGRCVFSTFKPIYDEESQYWGIDWQRRRYGVCDENGDILLEAKYSSIEVLDLDRYWVRLGNRTGMIDSRGNWYYSINDYESLMD